MGATTTREDFKLALAKTAAPAIGFFSQYFFMPLFAFALCKAFDLREAYAVGVILVGCCPGGATSNIFTYWSKGNVALSIVMSIFSNVAAFAMMPFLIYLLIQLAYKSDVDIPWDAVFISLVLVVVPIFIGLGTREYSRITIRGKLLWEWMEYFTSKIGIVFFFIALTLGLYTYASMLAKAPTSLWIIAILMEPAGAAFGYTFSTLAGLSYKDRRTIGVETGVQSFSLAIAIVAFSFKGDFHDDAILFPILYALMYLMNSFWIVLVLRYIVAPYEDEQVSQEKEEGFEKAGPAETADSKGDSQKQLVEMPV
ncbi:sodium bile acid symporter family-domain-containing protein [Ochromonadaceae sp. CCMP2298]|nr:sodium bile acid symporter family-domain-containing protein [Ochromonadaceae sp. CCMP2298]